MKHSPLKKRRLEVGMTQSDVAEAMGISQPNYQRWEAGAAAVPQAKLKKLARVLHSSVEKILGKPEKFDLLGIDNSVGKDRKYYGEVAFHFSTKGTLLLPISEAVRSQLHHDLQGGDKFIIATSLDNRTVFIRREAIKDVFISSEAHDTYGPEEYEQPLGIYPDEDFWRIVDHMDWPESLEGEIEKARIEEVLREVMISEEEMENLVASGQVKPEDREKLLQESKERTEKFRERVSTISWQFSSGQLRHHEGDVEGNEGRLLYDAFSQMEEGIDDFDDLIYLPVEGYHRSIWIRKSEIDYISIPTQKYAEGALEYAEEELDEVIDEEDDESINT